MANIFWNDKKAPKQEAKKTLMEHIADNWTGDGGEMIRAVLEVNDPADMLGQEFRSKFDAKWMGWRMVVLKVPIGHVRVFFNK
jgi:hypothetical protein